MLGVLIVVFTPVLFMFLVTYFIIRYGSKRAIKNNLSEADFKNEDYYRDILKEYSAAELSYIDKLKMDETKDIVATILNLKLKNKIDIINNQIIVLDSNTNKLKKTEKFILESIKDGRVKIYNPEKFKTYFVAEAAEDRLILETRGNGYITRIAYTRILTFICIAILFYLYQIGKVPNLLFIVLLISLYAVQHYLSSYWEAQDTLYPRTEKGEALNKKIEGLKKYIMDYSNLHEKGIKDLIIWEEYLVYSVIFDINTTTTIEEICNMIELLY